MKKKRKTIEIFNLSFLDVVSCGFGAIILLLILSKISQPYLVEQQQSISEEIIKKQTLTYTTLKQEGKALAINLSSKKQELSKIKQQLDNLNNTLEALAQREQYLSTRITTNSKINKQLHLAQQNLTEDMQNLNRKKRNTYPNSLVGGIPVDSEYIIFIIDTSGSMQRFAWSIVIKKMREILQIYPNVKGIQVMNDMGDYMFSQYAGRWIPDSKARRKAIIKQLKSWAPFSNSSPVEGITHAIRKFHAKDKNISIYIFGDDFSKGSIQDVIDTVDKLNSIANNHRRVRIHAVGFPVLLLHSEDINNVARFSALMRILAENNNGSFVGLSQLQ